MDVDKRWRRISTLFGEALEHPEEGRSRWLEEQCAGDAGLLREVGSLLAAHRRSEGILDRPVSGLALGALDRIEGVPVVGSRVGPYEILEELGRGGMGLVFRARDARLERDVALKFVTRAIGGDRSARRRLLDEARAAASIEHPNVCTIFDVGETDDGAIYIAMAYYRGQTLERRLESGPFDAREAVRLASETACGLAHGHEAGIIHRDIKPSNILITEEGEVRILDFGVASAEVDATLTEPEVRAGTIGYMSPEQIRGKRVDRRADIWALGVTLYEMLAGRSPFEGDNPAAVLHSILEREPDFRTDIPAQLQPILAKALAKDPDRRYRDMAELIADLESGVAPAAVPRRGALPVSMTSFVGRSREASEVVALLARARLITLTGPGGAGKTRLSLRVAEQVEREFHDRVFFVPLAPITDPEFVVPAIAAAVGVTDSPSEPLLENLKRLLVRGPALLVLDNFEQITEAAPLIGELLTHCPKLKAVITSRIPLRIMGEQEYPVPPLAAPPGDGILQPEELVSFPSVALFVERARSARPDFTLTVENASDVAELCRRLDGLPLAIELAAARIRMFTPREMLDRLANRFDLLKSKDRDRPARHQTLRETIACSYELLALGEQAEFRRLAVFAGGAALDAVEALSGPAAGAAGVLDIVESLLDHNLIRRQPGQQAEPRFAMLETIRAYALELLSASGEEPTVRDRHAKHYLDLAERAAPELTKADQAVWLDRLDQEIDNFRAALDWAEQSGDPETLLRISAGLWRYWLSRSYVTEGIHRLERVLAVPAPSDLLVHRARVLRAVGTLAHIQGDYDAALAWLEECRDIRKRLGDRKGLAETMNSVAWIKVEYGTLSEALVLCREALALNQEVGDQREIALAFNNLGWLLNVRREFDAARRHHEAGLEIRRRINDHRGVGFALSNLAWSEAELGNVIRAQRLIEEGRAILERVDDKLLLSWNDSIQGLVQVRKGNYESAIEVLERAGQAALALRNYPVESWVFTLLGQAHRNLGDTAQAEKSFRLGLASWTKGNIRWGMGQNHFHLGELFREAGRSSEAREHFEKSLHLWRAVDFEPGIAEVTAALEKLGSNPGPPNQV